MKGQIRRASCVVALAATAAIAGCSSSSSTSSGTGSSTSSASASLTKLNVALGASTLLYAPVYIAADEGYFTQEGLAVTQDQVVASASIQALTSGSVQLAFVASESYLLAKEKNISPIAIQANNTGNTGSYLIASTKYLASKHITASDPLSKREQAMKGATIGYTTAGAISQINAEWMLEQAGLPVKDANLVQVGGGTAADAALERGSIDMEFTAPPDVESLVASGDGVLLINAIKEFPLMASQPYSVVLADPSWLKTNASTATKFTTAIAKAISFINSNPAKAVTLLQAKFPTVKASVLQQGVTAMLPTYTQGGAMTEAMWQNAIQLGQEAGTLTGTALSPAEGQLWTNQYISSGS
jgi:NitT/TauT family transport system substrate-binding protein